MSLLGVVLVLIVIGVLLWLVLTQIPMAPPFPKLITAVVVIAVVIWLLSISGLLPSVNAVRFPHR